MRNAERRTGRNHEIRGRCENGREELSAVRGWPLRLIFYSLKFEVLIINDL
jgi:hypothetical protein